MSIRVIKSQIGPASEWFEQSDGGRNDAKLKELQLYAEQAGGGTNPSQFYEQQFEVQEGLSCQTMAIIEGLRAVSPASVSALGSHQRLHGIVRDLRSRMRQQTPEASYEDESMRVESVFSELAASTNLPLSREMVEDAPPQLIQKLFEAGPKKRFIVAVDLASGAQGIGHAYAIVPVAHPTEKRFTAKIDTLYGKRHPTHPSCVFPENMTLEQFVDRLRGHFDNVSPRFQLHLITLDEDAMPAATQPPSPAATQSGTVIKITNAEAKTNEPPQAPPAIPEKKVIRITNPPVPEKKVIRITNSPAPEKKVIRITDPKKPS